MKLQLLLSLTVSVMLIGCARKTGTKHPSELTQAEEGALRHLLIDIYNKSFDLRAFVDLETRIHPTTQKRLRKPIKTIGAVPKDFYFDINDEEIQRVIDDNIQNISATWEEDGRIRELSIVEYTIGSMPGAGGELNPMGIVAPMPSSDVVAIYPFKVLIK